MWSGRGHLGDFWAAYVGATDQTSAHAHVAVQLAVALGKSLHVQLRRGYIDAPGVLLGPLVSHSVGPSAAEVAFFYVESEAPLGRALMALLAGQPAIAAPKGVVDIVRRYREPNVSVAKLSEALAVEMQPVIDERLSRALSILGASDGRRGAVAEAASSVGLSESRLRAIACAELGAPLARWMLWRKLERAARSLAAGASLSEAALEASFSDQAHLTSTMRRMFGVTPRTAAETLR